jgi:hypothetical protein
LEVAQKVIRHVSITSPRFIRLILLLAGILSFVSAVLANSQILAFIGLGLTFWGALFFLITPLRYVEGSLLGTTSISSYKTMNRMIRDLKLIDHCYHVPPFPENAYLPDHLKGLKEIVVFVPETNDAEIPSIEEMAEGRFLLKNPKGILIVPPGSGLLSRIENDYKTDFTNMRIKDLCEILPKFILENLGLAEEMELSFQEERLDVKVTGSLYKGLYSDESILRSVRILGCPLMSAVACALAKATGKIVTVQNLQVYPNGEIKAECNVIQRQD